MHIYGIWKDVNNDTTMQDRKKRHRCEEHIFGLREKVRVGRFERIALKMYIIICEIDHQSRFDA